jgi:hypothetical protein
MPATGDQQTSARNRHRDEWRNAEYVHEVENGDAALLPPGVQVVKRSSQ